MNPSFWRVRCELLAAHLSGYGANIDADAENTPVPYERKQLLTGSAANIKYPDNFDASRCFQRGARTRRVANKLLPLRRT